MKSKERESSKKALEAFLSLCLKMESLDELDRFFDLFLTIEEKKLLSSRFLIIQNLLEGKLTQREIAKKYHVSIAQITRGSNALKKVDSKMERFLEEHI